MIVVPSSYDIVLTHSPIEEITGHWFEIYEYYVILRKAGYSPCMLFQAPEISYDTIFRTLQNRYKTIIPQNDIYVIGKENLIGCPDAVCLVVDGNFESLSRNNIKILAKKILGFACGIIGYGDYKDAIYLYDSRIYKLDGIEYRKKVYTGIMKNITKSENNALLYLTKNCRLIKEDVLKNLIHELNEYYTFDKNIILTTDENLLNKKYDKTEIIRPPLYDMYEKFDTYIYTPVPRRFDCSPRMIAECAYYKKRVLPYGIDYIDNGLLNRETDIEDGSVWMKENDEIVDIIRRF